MQAIPAEPRSGKGYLVEGFFLLLWLTLWLFGFPKPNGDDGFFTGAGIHLAETGRLFNPWVTGWMGYIEGVHRDKFFVQPPLYPVVLAVWVKLFGVSAATLTAFACSLGALYSIILASVARRAGASVLAASFLPLVVTGWILQRGLRPEALALGCAALGQLYFFRGGRRGYFLGGLFSSAAVIAHPFWITLVVPATLLTFVRSVPPLSRVARTLFTAMGVGAAGLALMVGLGRDVPGFFHDLIGHARLISPNTERLQIFRVHFWVGYESYVRLVVIFLFLGSLLLVARKSRSRAWCCLIGLLVSAALGLALYPAQTAIYLVILCAALPLLLTDLNTGWRHHLLFVPGGILAFWFGTQQLLQHRADREHDSWHPDPGLAPYLSAVQPEQVFFDSTTLRYAFDYRPPVGAVDYAWSWSPGESARWWSISALAPRDLWVINPNWCSQVAPDSASRGEFQIGGRVFRSIRSARAALLIVGSDLPEPPNLHFIHSPNPLTK